MQRDSLPHYSQSCWKTKQKMSKEGKEKWLTGSPIRWTADFQSEIMEVIIYNTKNHQESYITKLSLNNEREIKIFLDKQNLG